MTTPRSAVPAAISAESATPLPAVKIVTCCNGPPFQSALMAPHDKDEILVSGQVSEYLSEH